MKNIFYVKDYAKPNTTDSEAIRACFSEAEKAENRTVIFDGRDYFIDEAIVLPSNTHVIIDNCTIKQKDEVFDNIFRGANLIINPEEPNGYPLDVLTIENVKIEGRGKARLIGTDVPKIGYHPGQNEYQKMVGDFWGWRTMMICFAKADNFEISGIELSKTMCWAITFEWSSNIYIHDVAIYSFCKNGDGIDFRSGCHHCRVENLTGYVTDDGVACTALSRGIRYTYPNAKAVYPMTMAAGCVDGYSHDIHDIDVKNVCVGGLHHVMICLAANGDKVYNINIENLEEAEQGAKWSVLCLYTGYGDGYTAGDINNIHVNGVHSRNAKFAVELRADVRDIYVNNIVQDNPNGYQYTVFQTSKKKSGYNRGMSTCGNTLEDINEELFDSYRKGFIYYTELSLPECDVAKMDFKKLVKLSHDYGITVDSIHLPFSPFDKIDISKPELADASVEMMADIIRRAMAENMYKSAKFVVHASGEPIADSERAERMACAKRSLARLADIAAECGATIAVENLPRTCLGRDSAEILELISAHPLLRVCYDTNHLLSESYSDFLKAVGSKIVNLHISDYDFVNERHLLPGEGKIDWNDLLDTLMANFVYPGTVWLYEVSPKNTKNIERERELTPLDFEKNAFEIFQGKEITKTKGKLLF